MHKCTDEEFAKFKGPETELEAKKVRRLQDDGGFYCLDWKALGLELYGSETLGIDFNALDLMIIPCASRITLHDGREIGGDDDCIWD